MNHFQIRSFVRQVITEAKKAKKEIESLSAQVNEVLAKADEVLAESTPVEEVKPKKKRRYYKPKAKK